MTRKGGSNPAHGPDSGPKRGKGGAVVPHNAPKGLDTLSAQVARQIGYARWNEERRIVAAQKIARRLGTNASRRQAKVFALNFYANLKIAKLIADGFTFYEADGIVNHRTPQARKWASRRTDPSITTPAMLAYRAKRRAALRKSTRQLHPRGGRLTPRERARLERLILDEYERLGVTSPWEVLYPEHAPADDSEADESKRREMREYTTRPLEW